MSYCEASEEQVEAWIIEQVGTFKIDNNNILTSNTTRGSVCDECDLICILALPSKAILIFDNLIENWQSSLFIHNNIDFLSWNI